MTDVIIVGGGVIGLSIAHELAGQGVAVRVLEQGQFGSEASWAGAGILPPGNPECATTPEAMLRAESHVRWPQISEELRHETGIDNGYRNCGGIAVRMGGRPDHLADEMAGWRAEGVDVEELTPDRLLEIEPALNHSITAAFRLQELSQLRNPRHLKALIAACATRGVEMLAGTPVVGFDTQDGRIIGVRTPDETHRAGRFCIAGGAWSKRLLEEASCELAIEPVRGQIVLLSMQPLPFTHVIEVGARYLVPRPDGRILIGSTEEWAGFDKRNTASGVAGLIDFAIGLVPALENANYERCWAGLRPRSFDGLPFLGRVPDWENLFIAAGHFRAGLQLSPATAIVMRQLILEQTPVMALEGFACDRRALVTG